MRFDKVFLAVLLGFSIVVSAVPVRSTNEVVVEYFRFDISDWDCAECPTGEYYRVDSLVLRIEREYGDQISVETGDIRSNAEAKERYQQYNLTLVPAIVVNGGDHVLEGADAISEESLRVAIDESLGKGSSGILGMSYAFLSEVASAFSTGIFSGVSPGLMAMLAFILAYVVSTSESLKRGTVRALIFGIGLIVATILFGSLILSLDATTFSLVLGYLNIAAWIAAGIVVLIGLNLVGILKVPFRTKPFVQRMARMFVYNAVGLFILGILFFFMLLPYAFPLFFVVLSEVSVATTLGNILLLLIFSLGVLLPFFGVGLVGEGTPRLTRRITGRYRLAIRVLSGLILIAYGIWVAANLGATPVYRIFP